MRANQQTVCHTTSAFVNLDFTRNEVTQKTVSNGLNTNAADAELSRPNYMTGERCGLSEGCVPCDKNLTGPKEDGCLVPMKTGDQEWYGLTTTTVSDMTRSQVGVQLKCEHEFQKVPVHLYAEGIKNANISLYTNGKAKPLTSDAAYACVHACMHAQSARRSAARMRARMCVCVHAYKRT